MRGSAGVLRAHCTRCQRTQACGRPNGERKSVDRRNRAYAYRAKRFRVGQHHNAFQKRLPREGRGSTHALLLLRSAIGFAWDLTGKERLPSGAGGSSTTSSIRAIRRDGGPMTTKEKIFRAASIDDVAAPQTPERSSRNNQQTGLPKASLDTHGNRRGRRAAARDYFRPTCIPARYGSAPPPKSRGSATSAQIWRRILE